MSDFRLNYGWKSSEFLTKKKFWMAANQCQSKKYSELNQTQIIISISWNSEPNQTQIVMKFDRIEPNLDTFNW